MNSPILLNSGALTIGLNSIIEPETPRMQNPFSTAMLIDEVRFRLPLLYNSGPTPFHFNGQLAIRAAFWLGRTPLTRGFVPVGSFCKELVEGYDVTTNQQASGAFRLTWKLPKPLYVTPQELLICKLTYDPRYGGDEAASGVEVSYAGRSLAAKHERPKTINLPWVTHFDIPVVSYTEGYSDSTISTEGEIVNPFDDTINVQRFIGRTFQRRGGTAFPEELGSDGIMIRTSTPFTEVFVRAVDSFGNILVRDPTPFPHLFQYTDRTWTVNTQLPPKGFYIFQVDRDFTQATDAAVHFGHAISMVGHREVNLR